MRKEPVGPYTFGEEYTQITEKNRLLELSYNKKKNQVTKEQIDRVTELSKLYPTAQKGLISSAVLKGLDNKQFEELLKLQYKAVPKSQPSFPNTGGNDVYNSAMFNSTFGKVFNAVGDAFKAPLGMEFWNKSAYKDEPVYGTFKGIFRVLSLIGGGLANATVGKPVRSFVKTAEEVIETPFQEVANVRKKELTELEAKGLAGDPNVTMYDVAKERDKIDEIERVGRVAGFALTLSSLLGKGVPPGLKKTVGETFSRNYKNVGPSTAGLALEKIKEGQDPGAVWKSFGEGYFPQGNIFAESEALKEAPKYRGRNITAGRYLEDVIGIDPDSKLYGGVSGVFDFYKVIVTDPFLVASKVNKGFKFAKSTQGKIQQAYRNGDIEKIPDIIKTYLNSSKSEPFVNAYVESRDFKRIFDAVKDPELALDLVKANTADKVKEALTVFVSKNQGIGIPPLI